MGTLRILLLQVVRRVTPSFRVKPEENGEHIMAHATAVAAGTPCWWELATKDAAKAKEFYSKLCGWKIVENDMGGFTYNLLHRGEEMFGGLYDMSGVPGMEQVPAHWGTYFQCDDVDATAAKAKNLGATLCKEPCDIPDTGRMAVLTDPTGAHFMLFAPSENHGKDKPQQGIPDVIVWNELMTKDQPKAVTFYTKLFGYTTEDMPMGPDGVYKMLKAGENYIGGIFGMNGPEFEHVPPHWMPYIGSNDVDAVAKKAKTLGGTIVHGPADIPNNIGRFVVISDPTGATISFYKSNQNNG